MLSRSIRVARLSAILSNRTVARQSLRSYRVPTDKRNDRKATPNKDPVASKGKGKVEGKVNSAENEKNSSTLNAKETDSQSPASSASKDSTPSPDNSSEKDKVEIPKGLEGFFRQYHNEIMQEKDKLRNSQSDQSKKNGLRRAQAG